MCTISKSIHCIKIMISRYARYNWGFALDRNSTCSFCTEDRFSGFLSNANLVNFTAFAFLAADSTFSPFLGLPGFLFSEGPTLELVAANVLRRTFSSASIAQETTWKGSMQRCALGQYSLITDSEIQSEIHGITKCRKSHVDTKTSTWNLRLSFFRYLPCLP